MKVALEALLASVIGTPAVVTRVIDHGSKLTLQRDLHRRLQGYVGQPDIRVLVLLDRDDDDCRALKRTLEEAARLCGLATKTRPDSQGRFRVVNRIVVEELESWFLGDVQALRSAYPGISQSLATKARFRDPDAVAGGTWEGLLRILQQAGHYAAAERLPKIEVARRVSAHMTPEANRSRSFQHFVTGLQALLG